jgi:hypothetical protein
MEPDKTEREHHDTVDLEAADAEAITACDGYPVTAVKSLIIDD